MLKLHLRHIDALDATLADIDQEVSTQPPFRALRLMSVEAS
jgi:hypothetical protein